MAASRDLIKVSLSSSWKVTYGSLDKCVMLGEDEEAELNIQDYVSPDNCILIEPVDQELMNCDKGIEPCQITISIVDGEQDNWRFKWFSLLSSAKYVEVHGKSSREYITCLRGELVEDFDDMVMLHYEHKLYPRPECFHLTFIPRRPSEPKIWLYGTQIKLLKYIGPPPPDKPGSSRAENTDDFFFQMMSRMMASKSMNPRR